MKKKECCNENKKKSMLILVILFGVLLLFSVAQTVQISNMKNDMKTGQAALGIPVLSGQANVEPQASAPSMVGGC